MVDFVKIREVPWKNMGKHFDSLPVTSEDIVNQSDLNWEVGAAKMFTELHQSVPYYHAIYRTDTNDILGVANYGNPQLVQNARTFNMIEPLAGNKIDIETAGSFNGGKDVFGCFKVRDSFKILDDDIQPYFLVYNDHLKVDRKVTVLFTPIRVVCQNTLTAALGQTTMKFRVWVSDDDYTNQEIARSIFDNMAVAHDRLTGRMEYFASKQIDKITVEKVLDEFYPFERDETGSVLMNRKNDNVQAIRDMITEDCMEADDLQNYKGTFFQLFNGFADFSQHYYKNLDNSYDINYRMRLIPTLGTGTEADKLIKLNKMAKELLAA